MRRKVKNSQTNETKRYYEVPSEKVQEWSDTIADLTKQNQQFKAERDKFEQMLNKECECGYKLEGQLHDMTKQRDTLIDDLSWYKAKVSRLERENGELQEVIEDINSDLLFTEDEIIQLEKDFENKHNLLSEFSQHIGNKPSSSTYKYFRAKLNNLNITEDK